MEDQGAGSDLVWETCKGFLQEEMGELMTDQSKVRKIDGEGWGGGVGGVWYRKGIPRTENSTGKGPGARGYVTYWGNGGRAMWLAPITAGSSH